MKKIVIWPSPILKQVSKRVTERPSFDFITDMLATMHSNQGIGLSAIQIGVPERIVVMKVHGIKDLVLLNPEIVETSGKLHSVSEGCLSVPGFYEKLKRFTWVKVKYQTIAEGMPETTELFEDVASQCLQHEIEHLDGKIFLDHLTSARRGLIKGRLQKNKLAAPIKKGISK